MQPHYLKSSREAEYEGHERAWAWVQQYDPRKGKLIGHVYAVLIAFAIACTAFIVGQML